MADENVGATMVGKGWAEVIASGTMFCPGGAIVGGVLGDDKLARGMNGMAEEVNGGTETAGIGGEGTNALVWARARGPIFDLGL